MSTDSIQGMGHLVTLIPGDGIGPEVVSAACRVLEATGVPAGDYTRQVLASQHLTVTPKSLETDVKSAVAKVSTGEADATVVYVTDVTEAGSQVSGVTIPDNLQPDITYPIAVVKATKNQAGAQAFVNSAVSGDVQKALEAAGFLPPK